MSQINILNRLGRFIAIRIATLKRTGSRDTDYIRNLELMYETWFQPRNNKSRFCQIKFPGFFSATQPQPIGACLGFSISYGVMRYLEKLDWWHEACLAISAWNYSEDTLGEELELRGAIPDQKGSSKVPLEDILDRVFNYVMWVYLKGQISADLSFVATKNHHGKVIRTFLLPKDEGGDLELLITESKTLAEGVVSNERNERIVSVLDNHRISGYFTEEHFCRILNNKVTQTYIHENICILNSYSARHACHLWVDKNSVWWFYDPNAYGVAAVRCDDLRLLYTRIHESLGANFCVEIAQLKPASGPKKPFSEYDRILEEQPESFIQETGLFEIAVFTPKVIPRLLDGVLLLADEKSERKTATSREINLNRKNYEGFSLLHILAMEGEEEAMTALIRHNANLYDLSNKGFNALDYAIIRNNTPAMVNAILSIAKAKRENLNGKFVDRVINDFIARNVRAHRPRLIRETILFIAVSLALQGVFIGICAATVPDVRAGLGSDYSLVSISLTIAFIMLLTIGVSLAKKCKLQGEYAKAIESSGVLDQYKEQELEGKSEEQEIPASMSLTQPLIVNP